MLVSDWIYIYCWYIYLLELYTSIATFTLMQLCISKLYFMDLYFNWWRHTHLFAFNEKDVCWDFCSCSKEPVLFHCTKSPFHLTSVRKKLPGCYWVLLCSEQFSMSLYSCEHVLEMSISMPFSLQKREYIPEFMFWAYYPKIQYIFDTHVSDALVDVKGKAFTQSTTILFELLVKFPSFRFL